MMKMNADNLAIGVIPFRISRSIPDGECRGDGGYRIELTARSRTQLRPFHGHVTAFERLCANGGFARYRLVIEPWLSFLGHRQDSYIFQDQTIFDILENV